MITDSDIEKVFDWLEKTANDAALARAHRVRLEEGRKRMKAKLMKKHAELPVSAQEREAYADPEYNTHIEGLVQAVYEDERIRWLKDTAIAKIEAWRTMESSRRGMSKVG